jgi:hypothetical protein
MRVDEGERAVSRQIGPICPLRREVAINTIRAMIDRAARDHDFMLRFARDPIGTAYAEGYAISTHELKQLLGLAEASDAEVVMTLQMRLGDIAERQQ